MKSSYKTANAGNYPDKKQVLDAFISVVKLLPEEKRLNALGILINNVSQNVSQTVNICKSVSQIISKFSTEDNLEYLRKLISFGKKNPNDGVPFIDYTSGIIGKFDVTQRTKALELLVSSYYNFFSQSFAKQKEATDLFLPMLPKIKSEHQAKAIMQYYSLYLNKNYERENTIARIDNEYEQSINEIETLYNQEKAQAELDYQNKKLSKEQFRLKSLYGIGGGILLVVLIASILVFFSIQHSLRKIEEKITENSNP